MGTGREAHIILLTGVPGGGKTTAVRKVCSRLIERGFVLSGFYTEEVRSRGERRGFRAVSLDGRQAVLADVSIRGPHQVSRYGVDLASFDGLVLDLLRPRRGVDLYVVDEIGKMECFSPRFVASVRLLLDSGASLLATVASRGGGLITEVKRTPGAALIQLTRSSRDQVPQQVLERLVGS